MSSRTLIVVALALVCGLVAAVFVNQMVAVKPPPVDDRVEVLIALKDIPAGAEVTREMIGAKKYPRDMLPPLVFTKIEDVLKRSALTEIYAGDALIKPRLTDVGKGALDFFVKEGWRAYTIQVVDPSFSLGGMLRPRSKVDVHVTLRGEGGDKDATGPMATILLQRVEVLAVDQRLSAMKENEKGERLRTVTLMIQPDQASMLQLGQMMGSLHLVLRHPEDVTEVAATNIVPEHLRGQGRAVLANADSEMFELSEQNRKLALEVDRLRTDVLKLLAKPVVAPQPAPRRAEINLYDGSSLRRSYFELPRLPEPPSDAREPQER